MPDDFQLERVMARSRAGDRLSRTEQRILDSALDIRIRTEEGDRDVRARFVAGPWAVTSMFQDLQVGERVGDHIITDPDEDDEVFTVTHVPTGRDLEGARWCSLRQATDLIERLRAEDLGTFADEDLETLHESRQAARMLELVELWNRRWER